MNDNMTKPLNLIWGAAAIGNVIGRSRRATFHMLEKGLIRGVKKVGGRWVGEYGKIREGFIEDASDDALRDASNRELSDG